MATAAPADKARFTIAANRTFLASIMASISASASRISPPVVSMSNTTIAGLSFETWSRYAFICEAWKSLPIVPRIGMTMYVDLPIAEPCAAGAAATAAANDGAAARRRRATHTPALRGAPLRFEKWPLPGISPPSDKCRPAQRSRHYRESQIPMQEVLFPLSLPLR